MNIQSSIIYNLKHLINMFDKNIIEYMSKTSMLSMNNILYKSQTVSNESVFNISNCLRHIFY